MKRMTKVKSLYIHIPFCDSICDYCDFTKLLYNEKFANEYLENLKRELKEYSPFFVETIYIGGGTPTSLPYDNLAMLLKEVSFFASAVKEYTVEANPENLTLEKLKLLKDYGVNRLSIGVQTTDDNISKKINRGHSFSQVKNAIKNAREIGFDNINIDLIIGLPNVTKNMFMKDLENVVSLNVDHISCYSLTVHPNTVFYNKNIEEPTPEFARELYDFAHEYLLEKGYIHYEVSNWSKPNKMSLHNLTYWNNDFYYGIGLGASGYLEKKRYRNFSNIQRYGKPNFVEEIEELNITDLRTYQLLTNLRTIFGLDLEKFKNTFNEDLLVTKRKEIEELQKDGLIVVEDNHLKPTYNGMMLLDQILLKLI